MIPSESDVESPRVLHRMYSDVCGPMETTAQKGYCYFITFIDGYSHRLIIKLIKLKNEVPRLTREYLERAKAETGERTNYFHSDGGREYRLTVLQDYFKSKGIHHEMTNAYTPCCSREDCSSGAPNFAVLSYRSSIQEFCDTL